MKAYIIGDKKNSVSVNGMMSCANSLTKLNSDLFLEIVQQTSPKNLKEELRHFYINTDIDLKWTYPLNDESGIDEETGMSLKPYRTNSIDKIFSCTVSHAKLWLKCVQLEEEIMILEHDAIFTRKFKRFEWEGGVLGLNDPRRATHSSLIYHNLASLREGVHSAPWVSSYTAMPQGLAGNSAYIIKPKFADMLLMKLKEKGGWPNDAIMCKQFFPMQLKVVYPYYTTIQGIKSTTTS